VVKRDVRPAAGDPDVIDDRAFERELRFFTRRLFLIVDRQMFGGHSRTKQLNMDHVHEVQIANERCSHRIAVAAVLTSRHVYGRFVKGDDVLVIEVAYRL